jgi:hypothetical protein
MPGVRETREATPYGVVIRQDMLSGTQWRIAYQDKRGNPKGRYFGSKGAAVRFLKKLSETRKPLS